MEGEQTWPTEEELAEAEKRMGPKKYTKRVPKGTSEYQAAWIVESDDGEGIISFTFILLELLPSSFIPPLTC